LGPDGFQKPERMIEKSKRRPALPAAFRARRAANVRSLNFDFYRIK